MRRIRIPLQIIVLCSIVFLLTTESVLANHSENTSGVPATKVADYIHSIIEADRTIYSEIIVERLAATISLQATENWKEENTLPLPAQFLSLSSQLIKEKGIGMHYRLTSLWPINPANGPKSEFEKSALKEVLNNPSRPKTGIISSRGKRVFTAIYADLAVTKACISCHNNHPKSPKQDFKLGGVMGGIVLTIPVD